jgi:hypothetical protein
VEQPALPLVERSAAEPVVRRAVVVERVGHCSSSRMSVGEVRWSNGEDGCWRMWPARRGRPRYIAALALTRLAAWLAGHRRQPLQRAEDDVCGKDDARKMRR